MKRTLRLRLAVDARAARYALPAALLLGLPIRLAADSLTLTATYPPSSGMFNSLITYGSATPSLTTPYLNNTYLNTLPNTLGLKSDVIISPIAPSGSYSSLPSNGHVGIGTSNPYAKLDVAGSSGGGHIRAMDSTSPTAPTSDQGLEFYSQSGAGYIQANKRIGVSATAMNLYINASGGNVQIGGTGATVNIGNAAGGQTFSVNGEGYKTSGTASFWNASDARLKDVGGAFAAGIKEISGLDPVRFRYKKDNPLGLRSDKEFIGLVAQDVRKTVPEAVSQDSKGYLMFNGDPVYWAMLNAIKDNQREIEALRAQLSAPPVKR